MREKSAKAKGPRRHCARRRRRRRRGCAHLQLVAYICTTCLRHEGPSIEIRRRRSCTWNAVELRNDEADDATKFWAKQNQGGRKPNRERKREGAREPENH